MIPSTSYTTKWYITLFANSIPFQTQLRLWDAFFLEGRDLIVIVAIAVLWVFKRKTKSLSLPSVLSWPTDLDRWSHSGSRQLWDHSFPTVILLRPRVRGCAHEVDWTSAWRQKTPRRYAYVAARMAWTCCAGERPRRIIITYPVQPFTSMLYLVPLSASISLYTHSWESSRSIWTGSSILLSLPIIR